MLLCSAFVLFKLRNTKVECALLVDFHTLRFPYLKTHNRINKRMPKLLLESPTKCDGLSNPDSKAASATVLDLLVNK